MESTVLIVDDTEDMRMIHSAFLQRMGYRVLEARDGSEAVRLANEMRPDAILMDLALPVLDGWGAIEALHGDPDTAGIPIIVLSSENDPTCRERAHAAGCAAFLSKPCGAKKLAASMARVVGGSGQHVDPEELLPGGP